MQTSARMQCVCCVSFLPYKWLQIDNTLALTVGERRCKGAAEHQACGGGSKRPTHLMFIYTLSIDTAILHNTACRHSYCMPQPLARVEQWHAILEFIFQRILTNCPSITEKKIIAQLCLLKHYYQFPALPQCSSHIRHSSPHYTSTLKAQSIKPQASDFLKASL